MSDLTTHIQILGVRWNSGRAEQVVRDIAARYRTAGSADEALAATVEQMRQVLREQLTQSHVAVEQIRLLELSDRLEQALGRYDVALSLVKNLRHLAERKTNVMHQARAAFLLADAWYMVSALPFAIDWSKRGFAESKPFEQRNQGGKPQRIVYATEETKLAQRLAFQGGMHEQALRLLADAVKRFEAIGETAGAVVALGTTAQVYLMHGQWNESLEAAAQARQIDEPLSNQAAMVTALWAGAVARARLGDIATATEQIQQAKEAAQQADDTAGMVAVFASESLILLLSGRGQESLAAANQAVALGERWNHGLLLRWALLERAWAQLAVGPVDVDEIRAAGEAFGKFGAGPLSAEAHYALYHAMGKEGPDAKAAYDMAMEQFAQLKMGWHLERARTESPLTGTIQ